MATITINDDWQISSNTLCWTVQEKGIWDKKLDKQTWIARTFHHTLEEAVKSYKKRAFRLSDAETVEELIEAANLINKEVNLVFEAALDDISAPISKDKV